MKYSVYAVRDKKIGFLQPMLDANDQSAMRNFAYGINNSDQISNFAPKDFDLYKIGEFDSDTGKINPIEVLELICEGESVYNA